MGSRPSKPTKLKFMKTILKILVQIVITFLGAGIVKFLISGTEIDNSYITCVAFICVCFVVRGLFELGDYLYELMSK